jgi:hypothetical protein
MIFFSKSISSILFYLTPKAINLYFAYKTNKYRLKVLHMALKSTILTGERIKRLSS